jgi:hypothetical protein
MTTKLTYTELRAAHAALLDRKAAAYTLELQAAVDEHLAAIIARHDEMGDRPACPRVPAEEAEEQVSAVVDRVFSRMVAA